MPAARPAPRGLGAAPPQRADLTTSLLVAAGASLLAVAVCLNALLFVSRQPALLPALALGAVVAGAMLLQPAWIFPAFVGVTWTSIRPEMLGGLPSPIELGAIVFLAVAGVRMVHRPALVRDVALVTLLLGLPLVVASLMSANPEAVTILPDELKGLLFLPLVAFCVVSARDVDRVASVLTFTGAVLGAGAISTILVGPSHFFPIADVDLRVEAPRAVGPFGEANFFALSLAMLMPFALLQVTRGGKAAWMGAATALLLTGGVLAAGSRGGLLTILVISVATAWWSGDRRLRYATVATFCGLVLLLPLFAGQAQSSQERSIEGRATENVIAAVMWADHPIVGVGPKQYPVLYRDYARDIGSDARVLREPHNLVLELAAEQGLVGLLAWSAVALITALAVVHARMWTTMLGKSVLLSLGAYFFGTLFLHGSQVRLMYMLIGLILALSSAMLASRRLASTSPA
jgi:O-antigen ligase